MFTVLTDRVELNVMVHMSTFTPWTKLAVLMPVKNIKFTCLPWARKIDFLEKMPTF